jgi:hypothetical protein
MGPGFDEAWADAAVEQLARDGVAFTDGLDDRQIAQISEVFGVHVPDELVLFLRAGVPTSPKWARWTDGARSVLRSTREWIDRAFAFDIEQGQYWHPLFGVRPPSLHDAVGQALAVVRAAPPLIPIYAHRFITTHERAEPRAVLSVWQAVDSIFYGYDLAEYFAREFRINRPNWAARDAPPVPVWEDLFDLFGTGESDEPPPDAMTGKQ